jgi:hypothetical protein
MQVNTREFHLAFLRQLLSAQGLVRHLALHACKERWPKNPPHLLVQVLKGCTIVRASESCFPRNFSSIIACTREETISRTTLPGMFGISVARVMVKTRRNRTLGSSFDAQKGGESIGVLRYAVSVAVAESVAEYRARCCTRERMGNPETHHIRELESSRDALVPQLSNHITRIFLA